ncbi:hypothetical protein FOL46_006958 [Perkinsus olseni]|uniref:Uncharacterized protein n=1 Tax=Perkinsus olseni TaxID=32597 RepID=A0A7J6LGP1_PEROL|nr:hypothetical protein FOL46_006958 [Perkinsus olseni]
MTLKFHHDTVPTELPSDDRLPIDNLSARAGMPGDEFVPVSYDISLSDFDRSKGRFRGRVLIKSACSARLAADQQHSILSLHAVGMKIISLRVDEVAARYELDEGLLAIEVPVVKDDLEVAIEYTGQLNRCGVLKSSLDGSTMAVAPRGLFTADCNAKGHISSLDAGDIQTPDDDSELNNASEDYYIGTSLEPRHARRVFPCVDDPGFKAAFTLRVAQREVVDMMVTSISAPRRTGDWVEFSTPGDLRLPTYTVGLFIGPFSEYEASSRVRVAYFSKEDGFSDTSSLELLDKRQRHNQNGFGLSPVVAGHAAAFAFEQMMRWFGEVAAFPPPPNPLRIVALPHHRGLGLETFGSISVKDTYCILPKIADEMDALERERRRYPGNPGAPKFKHLSEQLCRRRRVARLMCHEVSHMWFGDMLTPRSFQQLWLKEGMARLLEFIMCELMPGWEGDDRISVDELRVLNPCLGESIWEHFITEVQFDAMLADASPSKSHPIECKKGSSSRPGRSAVGDSQVLFDSIAYGKGACVLRMLRSAVGEERFIDGLRVLLKRHCQSTYTEEDLWRAMADACGWAAHEIADWMTAWQREPGLPVVYSVVEVTSSGYALRLWQLTTPCVISKRPPWVSERDKRSEAQFDGHFSPRRVPLKIKVWWLKHGSVVKKDTLECWLKPCHVPGCPLEVLIDRPEVPDCEMALLINPELESFALCPPPSQETLPGPRQLSRVEQCALVVSLALDIKRRRESRGEDARDLEKEWYWPALWSIAAASDGGKLSAAGAFYTAVEAECEDAALEVLRLQDDIRRLESGEGTPEVYDASVSRSRRRIEKLQRRIETRRREVFRQVLEPETDLASRPADGIAAALDEEFGYANALLQYVQSGVP